MKIMHSRASKLEIAVSVYSLERGLRSVYCMREDSRSRIRRVGSGYRMFRKGTVLSFRP